MKLYFLRHGESEANAAGLIGGDDPHLTEKGRTEAAQASKLVSEINPDVIYVSTMKRALETAEEIVKGTELDSRIIKEPRIVEREMGTAANLTRKETGWVSSTVPDSIEGVEKIEDLFSRADKFFNEIRVKHANEKVLLVSHGVTIKVLLTIKDKLKWDDIKSTLLVKAVPFQTFEDGIAIKQES